MWFFTVLFSLYFCIPFLSRMLDGASKQFVRNFVIMGFILLSVVPFLFNALQIDYLTVGFFPLGENLVIYGVLGYAIYKVHILDNFSTRTIVICLCLTYTLHFIGLFSSMAFFHREPQLMLKTIWPTNFIMSACVFTLAIRINWEVILQRMYIKENWVTVLSGYSFGIYLVHPFVRYVFVYLGISYRFLGFIIIYLISFCCIWMIKKIPLIRIIAP